MGCSSCRPRRSSTSSTRCRWPRCGGWGSRPARRWPGSACVPWATSRTPRQPRCSGNLARRSAAHLRALAWGRDDRQVTLACRRTRASAAEETFATDVDDPEVIRRELLRLSGRTARGLRAGGWVARTVVVKLRLANFTTITRSRTLPEPTDVARKIYATACACTRRPGSTPGRGCAWSACAPPACCRPPGRLPSWLSGSGRCHGVMPSRRWTGSLGGSARILSVPPLWSGGTWPPGSRPSARATRPGHRSGRWGVRPGHRSPRQGESPVNRLPARGMIMTRPR